MKRINLGCFLALCLMSFSVYAAKVQQIPVSSQKKLTMTIYNGGRALVNDVRQVSFQKGRSMLSFVDISNMVMPTSVLFKSKEVDVLEQNFNFDLLTLDSLMKKSVGQDVSVEYINPATGVVTKDKAKLLSYEYERPILEIDGKIETSYPGRIIFNQVPSDLSARPSLVFDVQSLNENKQNVEVSYLTSGLSWSADYVIEIGKNSRMDLNGLVTLTNNTSVSYKDVSLQLVAGNVNMVEQPRKRTFARSNGIEQVAMFSDAAMMEESVGGYHLYTLGRKTDILSNQTKQVSLLSGSEIPFEKTSEFNSPISYFTQGVVENIKPNMYLKFKNTKANGLGEALPKGIMRVYEKDSKGSLIFVGEDTIEHTAIGQDIKLQLGEDFDVTAQATRTSFNKIDSKTSQGSFEIKIHNAKPTEQTVRYIQNLPSGWQILSENQKSQKKDSNSVYWDVTIFPEDEVTLTFKVLVVNP